MAIMYGLKMFGTLNPNQRIKEEKKQIKKKHLQTEMFSFRLNITGAHEVSSAHLALE